MREGPRYRIRSPESIARQMKEEHDRCGVRLVVFHDDNFFLPYIPSNRERYRRLRDLLRGEGLDDIGLVVKCRPNDVEPELFELLLSMGFATRVDLGDRAAILDYTVALARGVARADLAFLARARGLRWEMEERARGAGGRPGRSFGKGMPAWAAETGRLGSSVGLEISTELLPAPSAATLPAEDRP
jgi:hypothetical protein